MIAKTRKIEMAQEQKMETVLKEIRKTIYYVSGRQCRTLEFEFTNEGVIAAHGTSNLKAEGLIFFLDWPCTIRNKSEMISNSSPDWYK